MADKNSYGMTKYEVDRMFHQNISPLKRKRLNKHMHWKDAKGKCRICGKFIAALDMERIERELYGMPKMPQ